MWFNKNHLKQHTSIIIDDLHGYVLPHAGTAHTGHIISHTLRFKPKKNFNRIIILYYPSSVKPNIDNEYFHEFYVPWKSLDFFIKKWNLQRNIEILGINLKNLSINLSYFDMEKTLFVVSADFSHFLPMKDAISLENKASHSLQHRKYQKNIYNNVVDDLISFEQLYRIIPNDILLQWVGRSRSLGNRGVGYLSFLIREKANPTQKKPDGMFVTAYDIEMNTRECLGEWFDDKNWTQTIEDNLIQRVLRNGKLTSRLTGGLNKHIPIKNYTITYLYKARKPFIRGWHGVRYNAFYLPDVFLENTYENGTWIEPSDHEWMKYNDFLIDDTLDKLIEKANNNSNVDYKLYSSSVAHISI